MNNNKRALQAALYYLRKVIAVLKEYNFESQASGRICQRCDNPGLHLIIPILAACFLTKTFIKLKQMDFKQIQELINLVNDSKIGEVTIEQKGSPKMSDSLGEPV